jgi:hypothetical protein
VLLFPPLFSFRFSLSPLSSWLLLPSPLLFCCLVAGTVLAWSVTFEKISPATTPTSSGQPPSTPSSIHSSLTSPSVSFHPPLINLSFVCLSFPSPSPVVCSSLVSRLSSLPSVALLAPLSFRVPKPLIPVDGRPLINHWLELLTEAGVAKSDVFVVTNQHFYPQFSAWAEKNGVRAAIISTITRHHHSWRPIDVGHDSNLHCLMR